MSGINKVWYLKLGSDIAYLACDGQRFYNYDSLGWLERMATIISPTIPHHK